MPRPANRPNKVGEHQVLKSPKPQPKGKAAVDDDEVRTERLPEFGEALDASEKLWEQGTRDS